LLKTQFVPGNSNTDWTDTTDNKRIQSVQLRCIRPIRVAIFFRKAFWAKIAQNAFPLYKTDFLQKQGIRL
jgi:hypothetical protein